MDSTAGSMIAGSVLLSTTTLLAAGLFWASATSTRERRTACRTAAQQQELRSEVAELGKRVGALQRLLEGLD
ncbi:hypothetical protein [Streptomyces sp. NBC_00503]|uniref:hypothetical protein n=1 Tax=Streptomyces sp. NBC_00503 TaxID=2903659 RepID=UPI002E8059CD|nr:hypothetical protein [Streptomyces sp. NBC_00503]WUD84384.1 hypothetical protein OG490_29620 [Streptomyces sp. NBC_00503]